MIRRWMVTMVLLSGVAMAGAGSFLEARQADGAQQAFEAARKVEVIDRDLRGAIAKYRDVVARYASNRAVAANALVRLAACYQQLGQPEAMATYQRVVRDFADQPAPVATARAAMSAARPVATTLQTSLVRRVVYEDTNWSVETVSPDGQFALGWGGVGNDDLILRTLPAKDDRPLIRATATWAGDRPVFSRTGAFVAFTWYERVGDGQSSSIGVISTSLNATPRRITPSVVGAYNRVAPIGWSTDGSSVIVRTSEFAADGQVTSSTLSWVTVASGAIAKSIPLPVNRTLQPAISPDGAHFAYEKSASATGPITESRIYTMDSSGRNEAEIVRLAGRNRAPVWTSDGSAVLFISDRTGRASLWSVAVQNGQAVGEPVLVQDSLGAGVPAGVGVDGTVYFRQDQVARQHVFIGERGVPGARGLRAFNGEGVSWSPDGSSVAFIKNDGTDLNNTLIIKDLTTGDERQFDHANHLGNSQVRWSRDGASVVVNIRGVGSHIFDVRTGQFRKIPTTEGRVRGGVLDISPDGKTIYVASRAATPATGRFTEVVAVDVATGAERKLADLPDSATGAPGGNPAIAVSPDGQHVALQVRLPRLDTDTGNRARLMVAASDGSGARDLHGPYQTGFIPSTLAWTLDGQSILFFTTSAERAAWRLMRISPNGGGPVFDGLGSATLRADSSLPILAPPPPLSLTVSPDGSRVAFGAYAAGSSQLVTFENVNAVIARAR